MKFKFILVLLVATAGTASALMAQSPGTFSAAGEMTTARVFHTATLLTNGKVLIAGGSRSAPASAEIYDPVTGTFAATGNMRNGRAHHTATLLNYLTYCVLPAESSVELYDPVTGKFTSTGSMSSARASDFTATLLANSKVLIVSGTPAGYRTALRAGSAVPVRLTYIGRASNEVTIAVE